MVWQGVKPTDMTPEQLQAAEDYTANAIQEAAAHYNLLVAGYEELAEERTKRLKAMH